MKVIVVVAEEVVTDTNPRHFERMYLINITYDANIYTGNAK